MAQLVEQLTCNQQVVGSSPITSSKFLGGFPERPKGADCKSVVSDFGGPNPPAPTKNPVHPRGIFSLRNAGNNKKARRACFFWCRWRGSNPHAREGNRFWVCHVCQFHHIGTGKHYYNTKNAKINSKFCDAGKKRILNIQNNLTKTLFLYIIVFVENKRNIIIISIVLLKTERKGYI